MEHKKIIVKALKHFIRYNKNRGEIFITINGRRKPVSGLCSYVYTYSARLLDVFNEDNMKIHEMSKDEFHLLIRNYTKDKVWLSERYKVTKRRLQVAQMIINKLEKELTHS